MERFGLIGKNVTQSLSKKIHETLTGIPYSLISLPDEAAVADFLTVRDFRGINVTVPYKQTVLPFLDVLSETAERIGAVNAIVNENGKLHGYNTDYEGVLNTLYAAPIPVTGKKILLLGNGGAAKAVRAAIEANNPSDLIIVKHKKESDTITYEDAALLHADADVIINATPVGMFPDVLKSPIDLTPYHKLSVVFDIITTPAKTALLSQAEALGIRTVNGLFMLVSQAVYAAEYFHGVSYQKECVQTLLDTLFP